MESTKERKSFSEITTRLSSVVRGRKEKDPNALVYEGPETFFTASFFFLLGLLMLSIGLHVWGKVDSYPWLFFFGFFGFMSTFASIIIFSQPESRIYPKAAWYWILGKDPETS